MKPEDIETIVDNRKYFPGYHMNKRHRLKNTAGVLFIISF